jgi:hypothetical protein
MTQSPGPRQLVSVADDYSRALDRLEASSVRNTLALLRRSLDGVLVTLRRSYDAYLNDIGPAVRDPAGQPTRPPWCLHASLNRPPSSERSFRTRSSS